MAGKNEYRKFGILISIVLLILTVSVLYSSANQNMQFIVRDGDHLEIGNTNQRFRFLGGNHFNLLVKYLWGEFHSMAGEEVFRISSQYNISVIRFWATCSDVYWSDQCLYFGPNNWNSSKESFFEKFDELVDGAEKYNIYLIPTLSNGYGTFRWVGNGTEICQVGSEANAEYKKFVREVVTRYKDRAVILAWEIGNEGNLQCSNYDDLLDWYDDTANYIRELDQNHLISTGENNFGSLETEKFESAHSFENISMSSVHIYDWDLQYMEGGLNESSIKHFISLWTNASHDDLGKPVYFSEFGSYDVSSNSGFYNDFLKVAYESDVDGIIFWSWLEGAECETPMSEGGSCISPARTPLIAENIRYWTIKFEQDQFRKFKY